MPLTLRPDVPERPQPSVVPTSARAVPAAHRPDPTVNDLVRAAVRFDIDAVTDAVRVSVAGHGVLRTWDRLILPVWSALGRGRDDTGVPVLSERLFSRAVFAVLATLQPVRRVPAQVLLACADEEERTLPLDALAAALAEAGVSTCVLGARVPPQAVGAAADRLHPAVVLIWSQGADTADPRQITSHLTGGLAPTVVAAGPGWDPATLPAQVAAPSSLGAALKETTALLQGNAQSAAWPAASTQPQRQGPLCDDDVGNVRHSWCDELHGERAERSDDRRQGELSPHDLTEMPVPGRGSRSPGNRDRRDDAQTAATDAAQVNVR